MDRTRIRSQLRRCRAVGNVHPRDYTNYVVELRATPSDAGETALYMTVSGRLLMAIRDHSEQGKRLDIVPDPTLHPAGILKDTPDELIVRVVADSELYGRRFGTSRVDKRNPGLSGSNPYEIAETSATGRALGALGYGLLASGGLASADDLDRGPARLQEVPRPRLRPVSG